VLYFKDEGANILYFAIQHMIFFCDLINITSYKRTVFKIKICIRRVVTLSLYKFVLIIHQFLIK